MNNRKYEILMDEENTIKWEGHTLYRIKALRDFGFIKKGDIGGYVEKEYNLSHKGNCWIYDDAKAMDYSRIYDDSAMYGNSEMHDNSAMYDYSKMHDNTKMYDYSEMHDNTKMYNNSTLYNDSIMFGNSELNIKTKLYEKLI